MSGARRYLQLRTSGILPTAGQQTRVFGSAAGGFEFQRQLALQYRRPIAYNVPGPISSANANAAFSLVITSFGSLPSLRSSRTAGMEASP